MKIHGAKMVIHPYKTWVQNDNSSLKIAGAKITMHP
jgi:hypothetical protein